MKTKYTINYSTNKLLKMVFLQQHVNQDTNWDVPGSPEPSGPKPDPSTGPPVWKPSINNGISLYHTNCNGVLIS